MARGDGDGSKTLEYEKFVVIDHCTGIELECGYFCRHMTRTTLHLSNALRAWNASRLVCSLLDPQNAMTMTLQVQLWALSARHSGLRSESLKLRNVISFKKN